MNKETYNYCKYNVDFVRSHKEIFKQQVRPVSSIGEYLMACGYKNLENLTTIPNIGFFHTDILKKYSDSCLFYLFSEKSVYEFFLRPEKDLHIFAPVVNFPEDPSKKNNPRFLVNPVFYSTSVDSIFNFYNENEEFLIKPFEPDVKPVGFQGFN